MKQEIVNLGFLIAQDDLKMDPSKVEAILSWPSPKIGTNVRSFYGLAQYYIKLIRHFSGICAPMLDTVKGCMKTKFIWTPQ